MTGLCQLPREGGGAEKRSPDLRAVASPRRQRLAPSPNSGDALGRLVGYGLLLSGDRTDLLQQTKGVVAHPCLDDLAVDDPIHVDAGIGDAPTGRLDALEDARMRPRGGEAGRHEIVSGDLHIDAIG